MTHDSSIARALHIADQALGLLRRGELDRARALRQRSALASFSSDAPILFVSNDFTTLAGTQIYATRWIEDLARRGLMVGTCDVLQLCARDRTEVAKNVAALVTWGDASQTIVRRFFGFSPSPPLVALTGNVADCRRDPGWLADLVVCSTEHAMHAAAGTKDIAGPRFFELAPHAFETVNALVLHPPIAPVYFETPIPPLSERRAVVQINLSKRPEVFDALARAMPDVPFIAVRGYGEQKIPQLPNVTVLPQAPESPLVAYKQARVLIQPGIESYGLAAAEAGAMQVVTIVNGDGPGAYETMPSMTLPSDFAMWMREVSSAVALPGAPTFNMRPALLARQRAELDAAADALARLMGR